MALPSDWQQQIEDAQRLRGWLVNSFAQVEYLLGDLILRCREFTEYDEHTKTLPHGAADRMARVRTIIRKEGPLSEFAAQIERVVEHLAAEQNTRNLLVHGFCTVLHTPREEVGFHFQKFHRQAERQDARLIRTFTLSGLRAERKKQAAFAEAAVAQFQRIHQLLGWEGPASEQFHGDKPFNDSV